MSDMHDRFTDKAERDTEDIRAADPEEGITSYQTAHAQDVAAAEGAPYDEPKEDSAK